MKLFAFLTACGWAVMLVYADASDAQTLDAYQPSTESVTVIGQKASPEAVIKGFVQSYAASAPALGKMAKWARGICPISTGLPSTYNLFLTKRVRDVAAMAGAPLLNLADCKPNIDIVFTRRPQALLDRVRIERPVLLGFHYQTEAEKIASVRYHIQDWYTTETEDEHGLRKIDNPQDSHGSDLIIQPNPVCMAGCTLHLPYARTV